VVVRSLGLQLPLLLACQPSITNGSDIDSTFAARQNREMPEFWIGLLGLFLAIVALAGLFSERYRKGWVVRLLLIGGLVCLGFVLWKSHSDDAEQRRLIDAAKGDILGVIQKQGPESFEQLYQALNYQEYGIAASAIDDLVNQHQVTQRVVPVKGEDGRDYTVRIYSLP
jgi:hypothetical protein